MGRKFRRKSKVNCCCDPNECASQRKRIHVWTFLIILICSTFRLKCELQLKTHNGQWKIESLFSAVQTVIRFPTHLECSISPAQGTGQHGCCCGPILRRRRQSNEKAENRGGRNDNGEAFHLALIVSVLLC